MSWWRASAEFYAKMKKGQLSVDYLITIILLGIIALAVFAAFDKGERDTLWTVERLHMKNVAEKVAQGINSVIIMGDGANKTIDLGNRTYVGSTYNITIQKNLLLVRWKDTDYGARFGTSNLNYTWTNLTSGRLRIWNNNGTVYIKNI